jgi:hypothetical protein
MRFDSESGKKAGESSSREGIPNKATQDHRELINKLISSPKDLEKDLKGLEPKERLDAIIKLLEFTTPKQARVENVQENEILIKVKHE